MKTLKRGLIVLAIIAFLTAAYFAASPEKQSVVSEKNSLNIKMSLPASNYSASQGSSEENNLTKTLGDNLFNQIQKQNEANFNSSSSDINAASEKIVEESLKSLKQDQADLNNFAIDDKDLKISNDNSSQGKGQYLQTVAEIILKNSNESYNNPSKAVADAIDAGNVSKIKALADTYLDIYNAFVDTPAPSDWLDLHKQYVLISKKSEFVYRKIANFQSDPIKAYLLMQVASQNLQTEAEIKNQFYQKTL